MSTSPRIRSVDDAAGRDAALVALREVATESGQVVVVGISLPAIGPVIHTRNHAGFESDHYLDYPASLDDLTAALEIEDESAMVRSEMCAATLTWMFDGGVSSSGGFEEFFRWAVFADLLFDDDGLALLEIDGTPMILPVGWRYELDQASGPDVVQVHLERPHVAQVRETTRMTMRADGWSSLRMKPLNESFLKSPQPPDFVAFRPNVRSEHLDAWFRNEDVEAGALIDFVRDWQTFEDEG